MNSTDHQQSDTSQKKSYLYYAVIVYSVKIFCILHNKVALLTRDVLIGEQQIIFTKVLPNHIHIENIDQKIKFYDSDKTEIRLPFDRSFSTF